MASSTANPSRQWDRVPIWGFYALGDDSPDTGHVRLSVTQRVTRRDGRMIYAAGASFEVTVGDRSADPTTRSRVQAAWRAADQAATAARGETFDAAAWDQWWDARQAMGIFASFPASDDPDIVQTGYQVKVEERLSSGAGRVYYVEPLLSHLEVDPPGINLGTVEVPPGSPTAPAPVYAKGVAGGIAALDAMGFVVNADGSRPASSAGTGGGTSGPTGVGLDADGTPYYAAAADGAYIAEDADGTPYYAPTAA